MKLKKLGVAAMALTLVVGWTTPNVVYAKELQKQISVDGKYYMVSPLWDSISDISPRISASGTTLYPEVYIEAKKSNGLISGTMYLEKYSGGSWKTVTSWNLKGTSNVSASKSYQGTSGTKYRTKVVVTVDGERAEATSGSCEI
ncbi:hypothetical protein KQI61_01495 [Anaerocolumna aminovalerica]|uniref:hypothetical protein n=1 Tax=Anaerocolumna aminovalerica TaxID=1527 RepID=UPI001C0F0142|nr:hypothetical protein [Anaerocolumna aminovalerica]MBU5330860.1 hypothetical protein [Anaerocolumna aminovalerica]